MPQPGNTKPRSSSSSRKHENDANPDLNLSGIGNYVFERTVGQGNFAKVKLAKHKLTEQEVAIKIIDKTTLDEKKLSKLHREVRIMKMLNHPNIVKLFEVIETKYTLFLVMEYVSGGELYDYLVAHGRMKEKEARAKFRQILSAVHYCHKKRVIHRDLKAENLLMDSNMNVKIADFGFSNQFIPDGQLDTFCGSPPYAAPELFQGKKYTGPEVDIWSLGVILYVLCTGCLPFDGKDLKEMREVVCRGRYKVPFYLSDGCEKLLRKFLVRDPTKRGSLDMLRDDVWINEGYHEALITDSAPVDLSLSIDHEIVAFMIDKFSLQQDAILSGLNSNAYDDISAIYMLLLDQKANGKWSPYNSALSPMSPMNLQAGTVTPISKPTPMGTIGEENGDGNQAPMISQDQQIMSNGAERRDRSHTMGAPIPNGRQRPVTWVGNESQVERFMNDLNKQNLQGNQGSGPKLEIPVALGGEHINAAPNGVAVSGTSVSNGASGRPNSASVAHSRHSTAPATETSAFSAQNQQQHPQQQHQKTGVIGVIRNIGRRLSESTAGAAAAVSNQQQQQQDSTDDKPRSLRFTFNSNTTSAKAPIDIVKEIISACSTHGVKYVMNGRFLAECTWNFREIAASNQVSLQHQPSGNMDTEQLQRALAEVMNGSMGSLNKAAIEKDFKDFVKFEIEVCELPRLRNLHGLRFRRVGGPSNEYKEICGKILATLNL